MITRIKINGFKSLVDAELYFGPFTCIVGANAIGKSNFFDALTFLSSLADKTIVEAAKSVRSENQKHSNIRDIFYRSGSDYMKRISFEVDMLIPKTGIDHLGQTANATITSLRYSLTLEMNEDITENEPIGIVFEELMPITQTNTKNSLKFAHDKKWIDSILEGRRGSNNPFISTEGEQIKLHQDANQRGRSSEYLAKKMPRTLLSTVTAETPTAFLARQEMRNWTLLQFEPSALRQPNSFDEIKNAVILPDGQNMPATLFKLSKNTSNRDIYQSLTNKLKGLVDDVDEVNVDKDDKRELLTVQLKFRDGLTLPAQSLSDGTLRFLGLAIINEDRRSQLLCLEEPENGINPKKIYDMIDLLADMATDAEYAVDEDNPLRQVIINTHSPIVASCVPDDCLYLAKASEMYSEEFGRKISHTSFYALQDTWKPKHKNTPVIAKGEILAYIDRIIDCTDEQDHVAESAVQYSIIAPVKRKRTVAENVGGKQLKLDF